MSAVARRLSTLPRLGSLTIPSGIMAIVVKELRGRMRGRRAFIIVTLYVLLLAGYAWTSQQLNTARLGGSDSSFGQVNYASAAIGRAIFMDLLLLQTLMVAVLAPATTAGAISSEREHQTLDLLAAAPISSLAIVVGKLFSALAWVFVLILASIPVTALVFVFGGVAPDDLIRGYAVLLATAIGLGSIGIFFSAVTRRTGASTGLTTVVTLALVLGTNYLYEFAANTNEVGADGLRRQPPEAMLYLNPFVAQADVICGTSTGTYDLNCAFISSIVPRDDVLLPPDVGPTKPQPGIDIEGGGGWAPAVEAPKGEIGAQGGVLRGDVRDDPSRQVAFDSMRDRFWPKSVTSFLALAAILTLASVQFVTPTRRWRPSLPGPVRRLNRRRSTE